MLKTDFLKLNKEAITSEIISDVYESSLNPGIDYVDDVYISEEGRIDVDYYYDGELCCQIFSSIEDLKFKVKTYGK